MRTPKLTRLACLAALAGCAPGLHAQYTEFGPYKFDLKTRLGFYNGDMQRAKFDNKIIGFGIQARREVFGPGSSVNAEISWEHVPSRWNDIIDYAKHSQNNTELDAGTGARSWEKDGVLSLHPWWSFDARKETSRGFSLLVSYQSKMPTGTGIHFLDSVLDGMEWFAGLRLDRYKTTSEFRWLLKNMSGLAEILPPSADNPSGTPQLYADRDGNPYPTGQGAFWEESAALTPGAFAGIRQAIGDSFALEVGVRYFGTKHWDFTPGAYIKEADGSHARYGRLETGATYGYGIEFALVCKL